MTSASVEAAVLAANTAFYEAFSDRNVAAMESLWARGPAVACIHPGWPPLIGRERVMESWRAILGNTGAPQIRCAEPVAHVLEGTAFVICLEIVDDGFLAATNIFIQEDGRWLMAHHQAGPTASAPAADTPSSGDTLH